MEREREICDKDLAHVFKTKPNEAQLIEKVERREKKRNTENTFSQQTSNSRQAERSGPTMEPLTSKTVIHAGRASLLPGCKMSIVFLAIRTHYDSKMPLGYALFLALVVSTAIADEHNFLILYLCHISLVISLYYI